MHLSNEPGSSAYEISVPIPNVQQSAMDIRKLINTVHYQQTLIKSSMIRKPCTDLCCLHARIILITL